MNKYTELNTKQQAEVNALPLHFAFNDKQFKELLLNMGLTMDNFKDKVYKGYGGSVYLRTDSTLIRDTFDRHYTERTEAIRFDTTGKGYMLDMFTYELANHEYCITYDLTDTLYSLGLTIEEVNANKLMLGALREAKKIVLSYDNS